MKQLRPVLSHQSVKPPFYERDTVLAYAQTKQLLTDYVRQPKVYNHDYFYPFLNLRSLLYLIPNIEVMFQFFKFFVH